MPDTTAEPNRLDYRELFPWIRLFRTFRLAVDLRKIALAGLAVLLVAAGDRAFLWLPFAPERPETAQVRPWPWDEGLGYRIVPRGDMQPPQAAGLAAFGGLLADPAGALLRIATNWQVVLHPLWILLEPATILLRTDLTWSEAAWAWTRLLWRLLVWAFFGGVLTRMAAVEFARDERVGLRSALRFAASKYLSYLCAPLLPVAGIGLLWLICLLFGLPGRIPEAGEVIVGVLWFVPLLLAFVMTLLVFVVAAGWPLMYPTVSVEGSDAFDGFGRSYGYLYSRPWHFLWYAVVALTYGAAVVFFVALVVSLVADLAGWGVAAGMEAGRTADLHRASLPAIAGEGRPLMADADPALGTRIVGGWLALLGALLAGFVHSYFWCAATIIYFLLRRTDDATEFDEVHLPEEEEQDDLLPLVGVARSEQPVIERTAVREPPEPPAEGGETT